MKAELEASQLRSDQHSQQHALEADAALAQSTLELDEKQREIVSLSGLVDSLQADLAAAKLQTSADSQEKDALLRTLEG